MSTTDSEENVPALFTHCVNVYEAMFKKSKLVKDEFDEDIKPLCVYEGRLTELITVELYLSTPYYTKVTQALKKMGCIRQLRRGGGTAMSQWELIKAPKLEEYFDIEEYTPTNKWATREDFDALAQRVRDLDALIKKADEKIEIILNHIRES